MPLPDGPRVWWPCPLCDFEVFYTGKVGARKCNYSKKRSHHLQRAHGMEDVPHLPRHGLHIDPVRIQQTVASTDWRWHYQWRLFTRFRWPGSHAIAENSREVRRASGKTAGHTQKFHVCRHCNLETRREDVPLLTCCQDPLLSEGAIPPRKEHLRRWKACRAQVSEWLRPAYVWRNRTSANPKHPPEETPFRFRIRQKMSPEAYTATWEAFSITLRGLRGTRELGEARHPGPSGHRRVESACWHICSRLESGIFFIAPRAAFSITRRGLRGKRELGEARHPGPSATAFSCSSHVWLPFALGPRFPSPLRGLPFPLLGGV